MKELLVLIGLPASGKSTYAKNLIKDGKYVRVNRDDLRMSLFNTEHNPHIENLITTVQNSIILESLRDNKSVVVDNCNIKESYRNDLKRLAEIVGDVQYTEMIFSTSLEECLDRNNKRERKVPVDVIEKFAKQGKEILWGKYKPKTQYIPKPDFKVLIQDDSLPEAIICDLDGTLCLMNGRDPYNASTCDQDLPNIPVLKTIICLANQGYEIIFVSGREDKYKEPTEKFLNNHFVQTIGCNHPDGYYEQWNEPYDYQLFMRKSGDMRADNIIKKEIFENHIKDKYNVLFILDDRPKVVRMWRYQLGLTVFQLNDIEF